MSETKGEKRSAGINAEEWNRFCKEGYLTGLETALKGQEEAESLIKDTVGQGYAIPQEWLKLSRRWLQSWEEIGGVTTGISNPVLAQSRQCMEAVCAGTEPLLKASETAFCTGFSAYEKLVANPSRRYAREFNKRFTETLSPA